jgi:uncharacterized protein (DUF885 family)
VITDLLKLLCLVGLVKPAFAETSEITTWPQIITAVTEVEITPPQLDFNSLMARRVSAQELQKQMSSIAAANNLLSQFHTQNNCQKIVLPMLRNTLKTQSLFAKLLKIQAVKQPSYQGSIYELSNAKQWYQFLTLSWLGESVNPDELYQIGSDSFEKAIIQLRKLDQQISSNQPNNKTVKSSDAETIKAQYKKIEQVVKQHLGQQFRTASGVVELKVERSEQGADFPAPGYYNSINQTMYYHPMRNDYNLHEAEWLYLHEGIPGHHFQSQVAANNGLCQELQLNESLTQGQMAFVEGWAAYVETLGKSLGLLKNPHAHRFVLRWEALRAMRTMIDVGIHSKGWSDEQARKHWSMHFPEGMDVMEREITRIKRWPMQVNTYVYGKHKIEQLKQQLINNPSDEFNIKGFHQNLLQVSHFPIQVLNQYSELFNTKEY